jgi:hypothetical protein
VTVDRKLRIHSKYLIIKQIFIHNNIPAEKNFDLSFYIVTLKVQALITTCYQWTCIYIYALRYKQAGRGSDSRSCHWNVLVT